MFLSRIGSSSITSYTVDADVQAYLNLVKSVGGIYDGVALNAFNTFVTNLKADGLWNACDEIGVFAGIQLTSSSLNPMLIKLKTTSGGTVSASNIGSFGSGQYQYTGPYAGLSGNGARHLSTNFNPTTLGTMLSVNFHAFVYVDGPERDTSIDRYVFGARGQASSVSQRLFIGYRALSGFNFGGGPYGTSTSSFFNGSAPNLSGGYYPSAPIGPSLMLSLTGDTYSNFYVDGVRQSPSGYQGTNINSFFGGNLHIFRVNDSTLDPYRSTRIVRGYSYGQGLPAVSAARYALRWNQFMNTFGASALNTSF
jgi:hypothetical protein